MKTLIFTLSALMWEASDLPLYAHTKNSEGEVDFYITLVANK